jgi:2,4-diketo-3-deoxy-L-fuconate hydrolase
MTLRSLVGDFQLATASYAGCESFPILVNNNEGVSLQALADFQSNRGKSVALSNSVQDILEDWAANFKALSEINESLNSEHNSWWQEHAQPISNFKLHAPLIPRQIYCTVGNYVSGAIQAGIDSQSKIEEETLEAVEERRKNGNPYVCVKLPSAVTGPTDNIILNRYVEQADWEVELAVVIGKGGQYIEREDATKHIAGYSIANDITARDFVDRTDIGGMGTDWLRAKSSPGYLPLGPFITPAPFITDPKALELCLKLNGKVMQQEVTSDMIFDISEQIAYISRHICLQPGDVICTGAPAGFGLHYGRFLTEGDEVEASISGLGSQRNKIHAEI